MVAGNRLTSSAVSIDELTLRSRMEAMGLGHRIIRPTAATAVATADVLVHKVAGIPIRMHKIMDSTATR